jgi:hypothetical protein
MIGADAPQLARAEPISAPKRLRISSFPMTSFERKVLLRIAVAGAVFLLVAFDAYHTPHADALRWCLRGIVAVVSIIFIVRMIRIRHKVLDARRRAADKIVSIREKMYGEQLHQYRAVSLDKFPHLDRAFYDMCRAWFESHGFRLAGDIENVTVKEMFSSSPTVLRCFLNDDGTVTGCVFHLIFPVRPSQKLQRAVRRIELETECSDGTYLVTINGQVQYSVFPGIRVNQLATNSPPEELLRHHRESMQRKLAETPGIQFTRCRDIDDIIQFQHRLHALKSRYKQSVDWAQERQARAGRELNEREQALAEEIRRRTRPQA